MLFCAALNCYINLCFTNSFACVIISSLNTNYSDSGVSAFAISPSRFCVFRRSANIFKEVKLNDTG
ncbi:MAG: hypothetical protein EGQ91_05850 [Clostridiales bacterium]|nr:hypothetical protein [Clostridiales bacterium]